jgi:hypothetical protein
MGAVWPHFFFALRRMCTVSMSLREVILPLVVSKYVLKCADSMCALYAGGRRTMGACVRSYSVSKHPRSGWHASGLEGTLSGPMTVVVCEHQYCAVGEKTRRFTCSQPTTQ